MQTEYEHEPRAVKGQYDRAANVGAGLGYAASPKQAMLAPKKPIINAQNRLDDVEQIRDRLRSLAVRVLGPWPESAGKQLDEGGGPGVLDELSRAAERARQNLIEINDLIDRLEEGL